MEEKDTNKKSEAALREERILEFWRENKTFQKSLEKNSPKGHYVFYDGPPFATGQMHYGHILGSTAKDVIGRYQTMQGYYVPRKWGWDCHGLPIENIVEKELKIAGHVEIEKYGIDKFVEYARSKVLQYDKDWEKGIERIGRWVDFRGQYKTMDNTFIESVWWALSELNKKNLIYEGVRVLAYCARCETPIANSEIAMDNSYRDIPDISIYVKFELTDEPCYRGE
jgi:isoleucyl-tRNA synthetase